jgi:hypothetical protein
VEPAELIAEFEGVCEQARSALTPEEYRRFLWEVWEALLRFAPVPPWERSED